MSNTKEYNRKNQEKYYKSNSERVLKLRIMRKIKNLQKVKPSTIEKYNLFEFIENFEKEENKKYPFPVREKIVNEIPKLNIESKIAKKYEEKMNKKLEEYDKEIKKTLLRKQKLLDNVLNDRPLFEDGKISLEQMLDIIPTIPNYKSEQTHKKYQSNLKIIFENFLNKPKCNDIIAEFNQHTFMIDKIMKGKKISNSKEEYLTKTNFLVIPISFYENIPEFKEHMTKEAYNKYTQAHDKEKVKDSIRKDKAKNSSEIPHISQFHHTRLLMAKYYPLSIYHLITALYTLEPAKRRDYGCIKLLKDDEIVKSEKEWKQNNYLKLPSGTLILHKFKTGEKYQKYVKVLDPRLTKIIKLWLKITGNKKYLITKNNGSPFASCLKDTPSQASSIGKLVTEAFNLFLKHKDDDKNITINVLRQAWVNSLKDSDVNERVKLAESMGHQLSTAMAVYQRPDNKMVSEYKEKNKKLYDFGEKGYYYTEKQIIDYHEKDKIVGEMMLMR